MSESLRLKPWFHYTDEERSFVIFQAYKSRILQSEDLKVFMRNNRLLNWSNWAFPLVAYPLLNNFLWKGSLNQLLYKRPAGTYQGLKLAVVAASWVLWLNVSPFYKMMENTKEDLLDTVENRIGLNVKKLNDVIPRFWTAQEINRKTIQLYNQRNSFLVGYLYPYEESAEPLVDLATFPKNIKSGKNTK